ncbi:MAG: hypothetical protein ACXWRA_00720 [Pseudobdellovibrionaceae bacterium]
MSRNRAFKLHSFVQYFCIINLLLLGVSSNSSANCGPADREMIRKCKDPKFATDSGNYLGCNTANSNCDVSGGSGTYNNSGVSDDCESAKRNVEYTRSSYNTACGNAGMSSSTCKSKIKACDGEGFDPSTSGGNDLLVAFSNALGVPQNQIAGCPKYSGQGYFERKDKYDSDLKDINKDLKDNKTAIADLNDDFTSKMKKIQEDIADAQKEYQDLQKKTGEDQRNRATDNAKTAADLAQKTRTLQTLILNKHQDIDSLYTEKNNSLAQITESAATRTCMQQVQDLRKKYDAITFGSMRAQFQQASVKKKDLTNLFQECMVKFDQGRMKIIQQTAMKIDSAENDIRNAQSDIDNITTQLSLMNSTEAQAKQAEQTALTNAQNALQQKIQRATTELQSLQTSTQAKNKALTDEQTTLTQRSKSVEMSIANLGAQPSDESSTTKLSQVAGAFEDYRAADDLAVKACGSHYSSALSSSRSSRSSASTKSSSGEQ